MFDPQQRRHSEENKSCGFWLNSTVGLILQHFILQLQMCNAIPSEFRLTNFSQLYLPLDYHPHSWVYTRTRGSNTQTHIFFFIPSNCCWCVWAECPGWCRCRDDAAGWSAGRFSGGRSLTRCAGKGLGRQCWQSSHPLMTKHTEIII